MDAEHMTLIDCIFRVARTVAAPIPTYEQAYAVQVPTRTALGEA